MFHKKVPVVSAIEALESRIAPAVVFLTGTDAVRNGVSVAVPDFIATNDLDAAFLLRAGDSLVVDVNHDGIFKASDDLLLAKVSKGRALLLFEDLDGVSGFSNREVVGAMVSNGFVGEINGDVLGSVVAGLTARGAVDWDTIPSTIAGLTVTGSVYGQILADGAIKNVTIKSAGNDDRPSVLAIRSGADGGEFYFGTTPWEYISSATSKSPSDLSNISLARGVLELVSGWGQDGGDISNVTIGRQLTPLIIRAGDSMEFSGGNGGSIRDVTIHGASNFLDILIQAGQGTMRKTHAGAGGSIDSVSILAEGANLAGVAIMAGSGGDSEYLDVGVDTHARGGNGGSVRGVTVLAGSIDGLGIYSGRGGNGGYFHQDAVIETREKVVRSRDAYGEITEEVVEYDVVIKREINRGGAGGDGGDIEDIQVHARAFLGLESGQGGYSQLRNAGDGGSIHNVEAVGLAGGNIIGGLGGSGVTGGHGGSISGFSASDLAALTEVDIRSGYSGGGLKKAGSAGDIARISLSSDEAIGRIIIEAGNGASAEDYSSDSTAKGGEGGSVSAINIDVVSSSTILVTGGAGGSGGYRATSVGNPDYGLVVQKGGAGGNGGSVDHVVIHAQQLLGNEDLHITSGPGGNGRVAKPGGSGGNISNIELVNYPNGEIRAGAGGTSTAGRSGDGGDLSNLTFSGGLPETSFEVSAGDGGFGGDEGGSGGNGGSISKVRGMEIEAGGVSLSAGRGGNGTEFMVEPQYVDVEIPNRIPDGNGGWQFEYVTKSIKVANRIARAGAGGDGGGVSNVIWDIVAGGNAAMNINSGAGGDGTSVSADFERVVKVPDGFGGYTEEYIPYTKVFAKKPAGAGGDIRNVRMNAAENTQSRLSIEAGYGGVGTYAAPGRGGAIARINIDSFGISTGLSLYAGTGGDSSGTNLLGNGRSGGSIKNVEVNATKLEAEIVGGNGGSGPNRQGAGGNLANISLITLVDITASLTPGNGSPNGVLKNVFPTP